MAYLWQVHAVQTRDEFDKILGPGGAMEAFEAAKKAVADPRETIERAQQGGLVLTSTGDSM